MRHHWLWLQAHDLSVEMEQARDEGKDLPADLERRMRALTAKGDEYLSTPEGQAEAGALLDETAVLPVRKDYPHVEPSGLEAIRAQQPEAVALPAWEGSGEALREKIHGAWLGRAYGCYLGKPVEGVKRLAGEKFILENFLGETGQWPLRGHFSLDYPEEMLARFNLRKGWGAGPPFMPEDDDTNYTTVGLALAERKGSAFTPDDVADFWLENIPILHVCTAERVAYRNFCINIRPPQSASYRNPYREWIGAQIRADFWGYAAPANPELAAEYAWRDACISQVKNGIYGEMWVAAMLAAAYVVSDIETIIRAGLAQIPARCRLSEAIGDVLSWRASGRTYEDAVGAIDGRWDENNGHHWCHTISNAQIVATALLWSEGDYATAISRAVLPGFDTDCNGATVGSVMGMILGGSGLPKELVGRLNDRIRTGVQGYLDCSIGEMARRMAGVVERSSRFHDR